MRRSVQSSAIGFVLVLALLAFSPGHSFALSIAFQPTAQEVLLGELATVEILISELGTWTAPSLGSFDFTIGFDPSILGFSSIEFGDPLLGDQLDLFGFGDNDMGASEIAAGYVNVFELSFDLPWDLEDFQADTFVLASLTFDTLALGMSSLDIYPGLIPPTFGDAWGDPLLVEFGSGSISVLEAPAPIPEPATMLLLGTGLLGLVGLRKKFM